MSKDLLSRQTQAHCQWRGTIAEQIRCAQLWGPLQMAGQTQRSCCPRTLQIDESYFPTIWKLRGKTEPSSIWQEVCHAQTYGTTFMEQQEDFIWFKASRAMEKHIYSLSKTEQSVFSSNCCIDKEAWIKNNGTNPAIYFKGMLIWNGKNNSWWNSMAVIMRKYFYLWSNRNGAFQSLGQTKLSLHSRKLDSSFKIPQTRYHCWLQKSFKCVSTSHEIVLY